MAAAASSKIVLVTGANRGIGFGIAKTLSSKPNYHVLLGSRDAQAGVDAAKELQDQNLPVEPITIDITSDESIAAAAQEVSSKFGHLDVLINNAGVVSDESQLSGSELRKFYQETFNVNVFGSTLTTEAFIPLLSKSSAPRIVFLSSVVGSLQKRMGSQVPFPVYRSSKAALNMIMLGYASQYKDAGWKVNACCPGYVSTRMNNFSGRLSPEDGAKRAVELATLGEDGETGTFSDADGTIPW